METKHCFCGGLIDVILVRAEETFSFGEGFCTPDFIYHISGKCGNGCGFTHLAVVSTLYEKQEILSAYPNAQIVNN